MTDVNFPQDFYLDDVGVWRLKKEKLEELKKPKPMTNEEYLRSANVNDMARCIATKLLELARNEYGIYDVVDYATIFEWLKEIHHADRS